MTMDSTENHPGKPIGVYDYVAIAAYFIGILLVGYFASRRSKNDSISGYFLADRSMHWIPVGASLFASNVGSEHFIGLAGSGAKAGIAISAFELSGVYALLILGWIFVPVYFASGVFTMPEYIRKRFGGQRIRIYLSVLSILLYVFTKISADLFAGALFIKQSLDLSLYVAVIILLGISALFAIAGGLTAVIWTDFVQMILMLVGAIYLMVLSYIKIGGLDNLMKRFGDAEPKNLSSILYDLKTNESCSKVTDYYGNYFRPLNDPNMPWLGLLIGTNINSVWYWCSDQVIVQRTLSAKNISHAKAGCILAGIVKFLPLYVLIFPGMISRVLWPDEVACSDPKICKRTCGSEAGCTNMAYPTLVLRLLPEGLTGFMLSVMLAALMSSLSAIFNSASTLFTIDIYSRFKKNPGEIEQIIAGRIFVAVLVVLSILWIPFIENSQGSQLYNYIQSVSSYLAPPVCAVFLLGLFWSRTNESGAFWGLMVGLVVGLVRFGLEYAYKEPICGFDYEDTRPFVVKIHYLHFGIILFLISIFVIVGVSLLTKPIDEKHLYRLTFWTRYSKEVREDLDSPEQKVVYNLGFEGIMNGNSDTVTYMNNNNSTESNLNKIRQNKWLRMFCCMPSQSSQTDDNQNRTNNLTEEEKAVIAVDNLKTTSLPTSLCNIGAILTIAVASFFFGMYK